MEFSYNKVKLDFEPVFTILIPSWNNLDYLKFLIASIHKNSTYKHQIVVHINEGKDGTLEWVKSQNLNFSFSSENCGVCYGFNFASHLAEAKYLVFTDDDKYLCPKWDEYLLDEIKTLPDEKWCLSSTMIEPTDKKIKGVIPAKNFGVHPSEFDEELFLAEYASYPWEDWNGSQWYPMVLHTMVFRAVGGLSPEFFPGMYSDPDFMIKLWQYGIRYFKGISKSRAYHFGSRTTERIVKNDGRTQFILKWGLSANTFFANYLKLGTKFEGYLPDPKETSFLKFKKRIDRWKVKLKTRPVKFWK